MLWKACSLQLDVNSITYALNTLLDNGGTDSAHKKQDCKEKEKLENEVTESQKENTQEKEQHNNKQVEDKELQHTTQQEETQLDNQQQQETGGHQQQKEIETQLNKEEIEEQQLEQPSQEDMQLEKHEDNQDQEQQANEQHETRGKQLVEDEQQQKDTKNLQELQQGEDQQENQQDELTLSHSNEDGESQQDRKTEDVAQTVNATDKSSTAQTSGSSPVLSFKLHSLSIVHSLEKDSNKDTSKSATNKDTSSNVVQESSLLTGVSFSRENGKKDAAIIAYGIPSKYESDSVATGAAGKSKQKYYQPANTTTAVNDLFLGLDEIPIIPPPPINIDLDTPSWQLAPPTIPAAPPPPPVKGATPVKKPSGARHLQTFLISDNIDNLPDDASPVVSAFQPCGHNQVAAAIEYGPDQGGCVILFNLNNFYDQTIIGDSIIYEFKTPLEHVTNMCSIEKPNTDSTGSSHYIATIDKGGSLIIYNDDTGKLIQMVILTPTDSYVSCFSCTNVGLLGVVTKSGKVVTIRLVTSERDGVAVYGGDEKDSSPSLNLHQG